MPTIRKVTPGLVARDIIGVQPMTGHVGLVFKTSFRYGDDLFTFLGSLRLDLKRNGKGKRHLPHWRNWCFVFGDADHATIFKNIMNAKPSTDLRDDFFKKCALEFNGIFNHCDFIYGSPCIHFTTREEHLAFILKWG